MNNLRAEITYYIGDKVVHKSDINQERQIFNFRIPFDIGGNIFFGGYELKTELLSKDNHD